MDGNGKSTSRETYFSFFFVFDRLIETLVLYFVNRNQYLYKIKTKIEPISSINLFFGSISLVFFTLLYIYSIESV